MSTIKITIQRAQDAENRLELKEESEKGRLPAVKDKTTFKRFDLLSTLAVFGVLGILLFQSVFIFELYHVDYVKIEPYIPAALKPVFAPDVPVEPEPVPVG